MLYTEKVLQYILYENYILFYTFIANLNIYYY